MDRTQFLRNSEFQVDIFQDPLQRAINSSFTQDEIEEIINERVEKFTNQNYQNLPIYQNFSNDPDINRRNSEDQNEDPIFEENNLLNSRTEPRSSDRILIEVNEINNQIVSENAYTSENEESTESEAIEIPEKKTKKVFQCWKCHECFFSASRLKMHTKEFHIKGIKKPFRCVSCLIGFDNISNFNQHIKEVHKPKTSKSLIQSCPLCGTKFRLE